jgi:hypothetical protein
MIILIIWATISVAIGFLKFNNIQYILFSLIMLFVTYYIFKINPTTMSLKNAILISIIPNTYIWYFVYNCNNFLWVNPYKWEVLITIFFLYSYILIYVALES